MFLCDLDIIIYGLTKRAQRVPWKNSAKNINRIEKIECIEIQHIMVLEIDHLNHFKDCNITNDSTYEEKIIQQKG